MKIHDCIQGTHQWMEIRCGIPSASQFHRIITPSGKPSKSAEMYLFELLAERITGSPADPFTSHWMGRGSELEAEAVNYYEFQREVETVRVGFITTDDGRIGASPDRLAGDEGLLEIKVPKPATHIGFLLKSGTAYEEHRIQTQGQLWVAEKEWNDLLSYCPGLPYALHRVGRDEEFIGKLAAAVTAFADELDRMYAELSEMGIVEPAPRYEPSLVDVLKASMIEINKSRAPSRGPAGE